MVFLNEVVIPTNATDFLEFCIDFIKSSDDQEDSK